MPDVSTPELISIGRSAPMAPPRSKVTIERETLCALVDEVVAQRVLLERFGGDLRTIAQRSRDGRR
jgi:hypothetical protein